MNQTKVFSSSHSELLFQSCMNQSNQERENDACEWMPLSDATCGVFICVQGDQFSMPRPTCTFVRKWISLYIIMLKKQISKKQWQSTKKIMIKFLKTIYDMENQSI